MQIKAIATLFLGCTLAAVGEAPVEADEPISLQTAIELAIANSDLVADLEADVDVAEARILALSDLRAPELRAMVGGEDRSGESENMNYRLSFRYFPANPWVKEPLKAAEYARMRRVLAEAEQEKWSITVRVKQLFADLNYADEQIALIDRLTEVYRGDYEAAKQRVEKNIATLDQIVGDSRRYLQSIGFRGEAVSRREDLLRELADVMGMELKQFSVNAADRNFQVGGTPAYNQNIFRKPAFERRPDLFVEHWRTEQARYDYEAAGKESRPWFRHLQLTYTFGETGIFSADEASNELRLETAVTLPGLTPEGHADDVLLKEYEQAAVKLAAAAHRADQEMTNAMVAFRAAEENLKTFDERTAPLLAELESNRNALQGLDKMTPAIMAEILRQSLESEQTRRELAHGVVRSALRVEAVTGRRLDLETGAFRPLPEGDGPKHVVEVVDPEPVDPDPADPEAKMLEDPEPKKGFFRRWFGRKDRKPESDVVDPEPVVKDVDEPEPKQGFFRRWFGRKEREPEPEVIEPPPPIKGVEPEKPELRDGLFDRMFRRKPRPNPEEIKPPEPPPVQPPPKEPEPKDPGPKKPAGSVEERFERLLKSIEEAEKAISEDS
ncbi:MAG: TolC family protein [Verrucomicrobiota bacterium]